MKVPANNMCEQCFKTGQFPAVQNSQTPSPHWGISLLTAGSMRFHWNEQNSNRAAFLSKLAGNKQQTVPIELIHSKTVYAIQSAAETKGLQGDGIITTNKELIPVVTVADCVPIFIYDPVTGVFGALHSGWKGTGIAVAAIEKAAQVYGSKAEDFRIAIGPHIRDCCYNVDKERADYFASRFTPNSVHRSADGHSWQLSLAEANKAALQKAGVPQDHIFVSDECTCCCKNADGSYRFGSFRRQTQAFSVQAAWVKWNI